MSEFLCPHCPPRAHTWAGGADPTQKSSPRPFPLAPPIPLGTPSSLCQRSQCPPPAPAPHPPIYSQLLQEAQVEEEARPELREVVHAQVSAGEKGAGRL